jgi:hypothetical protein
LLSQKYLSKILNFNFDFIQVWFKNRRAKWRKQKREEQERIRKLQEDHSNATTNSNTSPDDQTDANSLHHNSSNFSDESDLEVA